MFLQKNFRELLSLNGILALSILPLLVILSLINTEYLYMRDFSQGYVIVFFLYLWISLGGLWFLRQKGFTDKTLSSELQYTFRSIILFTLFFIPAVWIVHYFMAGNITETNLYLRAYGKVAFLFLALALCVSPVLQFLKQDKLREWVLLSRKIFGILSFIFFLKHGLEYFAAEYVFQTQYHNEVPYITYAIQNLLVRNDALSGVVTGIFMLVLGLTSNKLSIKFLGGKKWKMLQSLVYPAFLLSLIHIAFSGRFDIFYGFLGILVVGLRTLVYLTKKEMQNSGETTQYLCEPCGYIYDEAKGDPDGGIPPGTKFADIPDDWVCPVCGATKADFIGYYNSENTVFGGHLGTIISYQLLTQDVLELVLEIPEPLKILIGQYVILLISDFDGEFTRSYSVAGYEGNKITLLIKLKDTGRAGRALKKYKQGDSLKIKGIYGNFILQNTQNPRVYIATGTGLAPIYRMIIEDRQTEKGKFFFSIQNQSDVFYAEKLGQIPGLETNIYLTREEEIPEDTLLHYHTGRMQLSEFEFSPETEFYICGAPSMVDDARKYLEEKGYNNIYFEKFTV